MPTFNRKFDLTLNDIDLIEEALRARGRELSQMRLPLNNEIAADAVALREIEKNQRKGEELLGRLHDQKIFYRPKKTTYISG